MHGRLRQSNSILILIPLPMLHSSYPLYVFHWTENFVIRCVLCIHPAVHCISWLRTHTDKHYC